MPSPYYVHGGDSDETISGFDDRDDWGTTPGIVSVQQGRRMIDQYSDGDGDDAVADYGQIHDRRNVRDLPDDVPDPFFKRHSL